MSESSNMVRQSPYPLRSSRTVKDKAAKVPSKSELEDVQCVICMESPHNAVLLRCSSSINGCRPYICDTSSRHSNCFKQFRINENKAKPLKCPLCNFSGTYCKLNKHMKTEHSGLIPSMVDPQRRRSWEQRERDEHIQLMREAERLFMADTHQVSNNPPHPQMFQVDVDGIHEIFGPPNFDTTFMPRLQFGPRSMYFDLTL